MFRRSNVPKLFRDQMCRRSKIPEIECSGDQMFRRLKILEIEYSGDQMCQVLMEITNSRRSSVFGDQVCVSQRDDDLLTYCFWRISKNDHDLYQNKWSWTEYVTSNDCNCQLYSFDLGSWYVPIWVYSWHNFLLRWWTSLLSIWIDRYFQSDSFLAIISNFQFLVLSTLFL